MARAGERRHYVTLQDDPDSGEQTTFDPPDLWAAIRPSPPGVADVDHQTHIVEADFHPQVNTDTTLLWGDRRLSVMGVQNVDERGVDMVLLCEEVKTP